MTPVDAQFKHHDPDAGVHGDCLRACIASLLDLRVEAVPHFFHADRTNEAGYELLNRWLGIRGLWEVNIPFLDPGQPVNWIVGNLGSRFGDRHWMFTGNSRRGYAHVVVCRGPEVVHDPTYGFPHGIVGPDSDGHYWTSFLAKVL